MTTVLTIHLVQANLNSDVRHNVVLTGEPTGQPGVTAIVVRVEDGLGWCVLGDHPDNPGVSVTNGAERYAQAVCQVVECDVGDLAWYEVDSDCYIDELHLLGAAVSYAPLLQAGYPPRSMEAFVARAAKLPGGLPPDAEDKLRKCLCPFAR